jgi:small subunit ribosomal protein S8
MLTDPIADMLTRIRNANRIERPAVDMPATHLKAKIAQVLKDEGFVVDFQLGKMEADEKGFKAFKAQQGPVVGAGTILRVYLKYGPEGERVIRHISRASKPGRRLYQGYKDLRPVLDGLGVSILSTSRGVMSDRQAKTQRLGGELLCTVW